MKIPINLENYPSLGKLSEEDKPQFLQLLKSVFKIIDKSVESDFHVISKEYFGLELQDLIGEILGAIFDHKGIMEHLPNQENAHMLSNMYGHTLNPLHAAFSKQGMQDQAGNHVSFEEKFGVRERDFTVKKWMQGLLFYSYYCSLPDLAKSLALNDYDMVDAGKHENIARLIEIRPALNYQKQIGILPGKLIPETGFFDAGDLKEDNCRACQVPDTLFDLGAITVCTECRAGYRNE